MHNKFYSKIAVLMAAATIASPAAAMAETAPVQEAEEVSSEAVSLEDLGHTKADVEGHLNGAMNMKTEDGSTMSLNLQISVDGKVEFSGGEKPAFGSDLNIDMNTFGQTVQLNTKAYGVETEDGTDFYMLQKSSNDEEEAGWIKTHEEGKVFSEAVEQFSKMDIYSAGNIDELADVFKLEKTEADGKYTLSGTIEGKELEGYFAEISEKIPEDVDISELPSELLDLFAFDVEITGDVETGKIDSMSFDFMKTDFATLFSAMSSESSDEAMDMDLTFDEAYITFSFEYDDAKIIEIPEEALAASEVAVAIEDLTNELQTLEEAESEEFEEIEEKSEEFEEIKEDVAG